MSWWDYYIVMVKYMSTCKDYYYRVPCDIELGVNDPVIIKQSKEYAAARVLAVIRPGDKEWELANKTATKFIAGVMSGNLLCFQAEHQNKLREQGEKRKQEAEERKVKEQVDRVKRLRKLLLDCEEAYGESSYIVELLRKADCYLGDVHRSQNHICAEPVPTEGIPVKEVTVKFDDKGGCLSYK